MEVLRLSDRITPGRILPLKEMISPNLHIKNIYCRALKTYVLLNVFRLNLRWLKILEYSTIIWWDPKTSNNSILLKRVQRKLFFFCQPYIKNWVSSSWLNTLLQKNFLDLLSSRSHTDNIYFIYTILSVRIKSPYHLSLQVYFKILAWPSRYPVPFNNIKYN